MPLTLQVDAGEIFGFLGPQWGREDNHNQYAHRLTSSYIWHRNAWWIRYSEAELTSEGRFSGLMPDTPQLYEALTGRQFVRMMADLYEVPPKQAEREMETLF